MVTLFLAFFMAFACPHHTGKGHKHNTQVTTQDDGTGGTLDDDTGGETGHIPPPPTHP